MRLENEYNEENEDEDGFSLITVADGIYGCPYISSAGYVPGIDAHHQQADAVGDRLSYQSRRITIGTE